MRRSFLSWFIPSFMVALLGVSALALGVWCGRHVDEQSILYDRALEVIMDGHPDISGIEAIQAVDQAHAERASQLLEQSLAAYKQAHKLSWIERFMGFPTPDAETAANAFANLGYLFSMKLHNPQSAIAAFEESLRVNSGVESMPGAVTVQNLDSVAAYCATIRDVRKENGDPLMQGPSNVCQYVRMQVEALYVKYNLEMLKAPGQDQKGEKDGSSKKKKAGKPKEEKKTPAEMPGGPQDSHLNPDGI